MIVKFLLDAKNDREYALRIDDKDGKVKTRLFAFEPGKQEAQPLPPNTVFYAVEEGARGGFLEEGVFGVQAHVWRLETNAKGKLTGVPADIVVNYGMYIVDDGGKFDISFQLSLDGLQPGTKQAVATPGFPANFTQALDTAKFDVERLKKGEMIVEEVALLALPPHHRSVFAENARLNLPFALLNQPEEPKIMPLKVLMPEFNDSAKEQQKPEPRKRRAPKPKQLKP